MRDWRGQEHKGLHLRIRETFALSRHRARHQTRRGVPLILISSADRVRFVVGPYAHSEPEAPLRPGTPHLPASGPRPRRVSKQRAGPAARRDARIRAESLCHAPNRLFGRQCPRPTGRQCPRPSGHASTALPHRPPRPRHDRHYQPGHIAWTPPGTVSCASDALVKAASGRHRPRLAHASVIGPRLELPAPN